MGVDSSEREDQATQLKKLFEEVQQVDGELDSTRQEEQEESISEREMDVLNLPPRNEIHGKNRSRAKLKFRAPFIRLVLVMIILFGVISGAYYIWGEELIRIINNR